MDRAAGTRDASSPRRPAIAPLVSGVRDPFRVLSLPYDADPDDVRRAFRRLARRTHPDRGGSAAAFHEVRLAYGALVDDLDGARHRWRPAPAAPRRSGGLDRQAHPTCLVRISRRRDGRRTVDYVLDSRPDGWRPGAVAPLGGTCVARVEATETAPAFGVWTVPIDAHRFRCVFGPHPSNDRRAG